jgi:hypothetical protein
MDSHTLEGLTLRLEAAERALRGARRAMWTGSILVALAMAGAAWWVVRNLPSSASRETIEAQHFVVRDAQGSARGVLESLPNGGAQLVMFRDPQPGDQWSGHTGPGPFSFGIRTLSTGSQLMLWDRNGGNLQVTPGSVGMAINEKPRVVLESAAGDSKLWLMDSTGTGQALNAGLLADLVARRGAKPATAPKHRRKH